MPPIELPITQASRSMPRRAHHVRGGVGAVLDRQFGEIQSIQVAGRAD